MSTHLVIMSSQAAYSGPLVCPLLGNGSVMTTISEFVEYCRSSSASRRCLNNVKVDTNY